MQLTAEQLILIEQFASRAFTVGEIAVIIEIPVGVLEMEFNAIDSLAFNAFEKGRLKSQLDLRNNIYANALSGSSPAQTEMLKLFNTQYSNLKTINPDA